MSALWFVGLLLWSYYTYIKYANRCLLLCRYLIVVPVVKLTNLGFAAAFWITYNQLMVGTYWISITYLNFHLIYELSECVTFVYFLPLDWCVCLLSVYMYAKFLCIPTLFVFMCVTLD